MGGGCVRSAIGGSTIGRAQGISSTAHSQQGSPDPVLSIPMRPLAESKKAGPRGLAVEEREVTLPPPCRGRHRRGQMRTAYGISRAPRRIIERDQLGREQRGVDDQRSVAGCGFAASSMASASFGSRAAMTPYSSSRRTGHMASNECLMRSTCSGVMMPTYLPIRGTVPHASQRRASYSITSSPRR